MSSATTVVDGGSDAMSTDDAPSDSATVDSSGSSPSDAAGLLDASDAGALVDASLDANTLPLPTEDDTISTDLELDLDTLLGIARVRVRDNGDGMTELKVPSPSTTVERLDGSPVTTTTAVSDRRLLQIPLREAEETLVFRYEYNGNSPAHGWDRGLGFSLLWPNYCGALFPCDASPADGTTFSARVTGTAAQTLVYPQQISAQAPPYMFAIAVGNFQKVELGATTAGTHVVAFLPPMSSPPLREALSQLREQFDFYEQILGPYLFGDEVGSVYVPENNVGIGGMEHHPYWHVVAGSFDDPSIHAHEAAHGWFGNGIRIRCWEDFVLSEGVVSYLTARAMGVTGGQAAQEADFAIHDQAVTAASGVAWIPESCDPSIQFDDSELWSYEPYSKGALFLRAVAQRTSYERVDAAIGTFFRAHREQAMGMQDLIDHLERELAIDLEAEVQGWLVLPGRPN